ncbi:hypothetical protein [uncultured Herbaspirillum sp.]|uniref:hypothetical protein n=1 Tax=uncultured Herbaspirillum sp. TaxID=160236 RepID=UPI0025835D5E|nr:hypothetical protein [uncultured Herbaspirillum sp.]
MKKQSFFVPSPTIDPIGQNNALRWSDLDTSLKLSGTAAKGSSVTLFYPDGTVLVSGLEARWGDQEERWTWQYWMNDVERRRFEFLSPSVGEGVLTIQAYDRSLNIKSPKIEHTFSIKGPVRWWWDQPHLINDTANTSDQITSDGSVRLPNNTVEYQIDDQPIRPVSGNQTVVIYGDGRHQVTAIMKNKDGYIESRSLSFTLDRTPPANPTLELLPAEETSLGDARLGRRYVKLTELEADTRWQWSTNEGLSWNGPKYGESKMIELQGILPRKLMVKSTDSAGNESISTHEISSPELTPHPLVPQPVVQLQYDSGISNADRVTNSGWIRVSGVSPANSWVWSTNQGATWNEPTDKQGNRIKIEGDGTHTVHVKVSDAQGNASIGVLDFLLDTTLDGPIVRRDPVWQQRDPDYLLNAEPWIKTTIYHRDPRTDRPGELAQTVIGKPLKVADIEPPRTLTVSGLYRVDDVYSAANETYTALSVQSMEELKDKFSADFVATGKATLDTTRPAFERYVGDQKWYVWAPVGGDYIVSPLSNSNEWYRQRGVNSIAEAKLNTWESLGLPLSKIAEEKRLNNGESNHYLELRNVRFTTSGDKSRDPNDDSNAFQNPTEWKYYVFHEDLAGNQGQRVIDAANGHVLSKKWREGRYEPVRWDLDAKEPGRQAHITRQISAESLTEGVPFAPDMVPLAGIQTYGVSITLSGDGLDLDNDRILIEDGNAFGRETGKAGAPFEISLAKSISESVVVWIGKHVSNLTYDKDSRTVHISSHLNPGYNILNGQHLADMISSLKLVNANGSPGERSITVSLSEISGAIATATLDASSTKLWMDLDPQTEDIQRAASHYVKNASDLRQGAAFVLNMDPPDMQELYGLQVSFAGTRLDIVNDKIQLDSLIDLNRDIRLSKGRTIAGVKDLNLWYDATDQTLTVTSGNPRRSLSGAQIKDIAESIKLVTNNAMDGEWSAKLRLISNFDQVGADSTARIVLDTVAPSLDLDYSRAGIQHTSQKVIGLGQARAGVSLFSKPIQAPTADDIDTIKLTLSGPRASLKSDGLTWDNPGIQKVLFGNKTASQQQTVGAVEGLSFDFDQTNREITLRKQDGSALTGLETKAILEAIKFQTNAKIGGERQVNIVLTDQAGHTATAKSILKIDTTPAPKLKAEFVESKQTSYQMLDLGDILGKSNPHNLTKNEKVAIPIPDGMTATSFLQALKGISAEWGGLSITGNANTTYRPYKSFHAFENTLGSGEDFVLQHQSATAVKGGRFSFTIAEDAQALFLTNKGGFIAENTDVYEFAGATGTSRNNYDIGNIRLLYEVQTENPATRPSIRVRYDGREASVGDVIALHDGDQLIASKTLTAKDVGNQNASIIFKPETSHGNGQNSIFSSYTEQSGNMSRSNVLTLTRPRLGGEPGIERAKLIPGEDTSFPTFHDLDNAKEHASESMAGAFWAPGNYETGPRLSIEFSGPQTRQDYIITARMGGKLLGFDKVSGSGQMWREMETAANLLAPGTYDDLSVTVTNVTPGVSNGLTNSVSGLTQSHFWAPQSLSNVVGGKGADLIPLGRTKEGAATMIQTGSGKDILMLGSFGKGGDFSATVTDFTLGVDKIGVYGQPYESRVEATRYFPYEIRAYNLDEFVKEVSPINGGTGTKVVVDLDGAGDGTQSYSLYLQSVAYQPNLATTLFGV